MPCRDQLAEAMHRIDALLADVDDVRHTASREAAVAAKNADAIENRLKCASGWQPPGHAAGICQSSLKTLYCLRLLLLPHVGSCSRLCLMQSSKCRNFASGILRHQMGPYI